MKQLTINIQTMNPAFKGNEASEAARILQTLANDLETGVKPEQLWDFNGKKCGTVYYDTTITIEVSGGNAEQTSGPEDLVTIIDHDNEEE